MLRCFFNRLQHTSAFDILRASCSGCGVGFHSDNEQAPGFIPQRDMVTINASEMVESITVKDQDTKRLICQRCHHITHQSSCIAPVKHMSPQDLKLGSAHKSLFISLNDLLDFPTTHIDLSSVIPKRSYVLHIFTKADLLPLDTQWNRIHTWATHWKNRLRLPSLLPPELNHRSNNDDHNHEHTNLQDVHVVSSKSGLGMRELIRVVRETKLRYGLRDVYLIGCTNVGKSEFINCWHRMARVPKHLSQNVTASKFPGTTAANVAMPLSRFSALFGPMDDSNSVHVASDTTGRLIDTPGLHSKHQLLHLLESYTELSTVVSGKRLEPITYTVPVNRVLCLGSLAWIHYYDTSLGKKFNNSTPINDENVTSEMIDTNQEDQIDSLKSTGEVLKSNDVGRTRLKLTVWASHKLPVHFTSPQKLEKYQEMLSKGQESVLTPPFRGPNEGDNDESERIKRWPKMQVGENSDFTVRGDDWDRAWADLVIGGVGWVSISGKFDYARFRVWSPGGVGIFKRDPLMPFDFSKSKKVHTRPK